MSHISSSAEKMASSHGKPLREQMTLTAKNLRKPSSNLLLKDYLMDDLSSCSSGGFQSFPRRRCCTTVRFDLLEQDLHAKRNRLLRPTTSISHRSSCSFKVASSTISALHKASQAVINAVKLLPFPSISPTPSSSSYRKNNSMKSLLSKSLSRKMLSRSFWRKAIEEEEEEEEESEPPARRISFREFLEEKEKPSSDQHTQSSSSTTRTSVTLGSRSTSGSSSGKSNGSSWGSSSDFTWEILRSKSNNPDDVVGAVSNENAVEQRTTATKTTSEDSTDGFTLEKIMDWAREEKEQLSPVSVLNASFGDDEDVNSTLDSTSRCRLEGDETIGGSKSRQMRKKRQEEEGSRHFDDVASSLKPIDLEKRIAMLSEAEEKSGEGSISSEEEAWKMVNELEIFSSRPMNRAEKKLLLDLFTNSENNEEASKVAKEWMSVESQGVSDVGWEGCVREMDKCERWTNISDEQVRTQLEAEVLKSLMNELVLELITQSQSS